MNGVLIEPSVARRIPLRCFSLYVDYPAGIRAKRLTSDLAGFTLNGCEFSSEMWKLDSVAPMGSIRRMIAQEAGESDIILLATTSLESNPALLEWLNSLVPWKSNRLVPGLLIGLVGESEIEESNWLARELTAFAQRTGMRLLWQTKDGEFGEGFERLLSGVACLLERKQLCWEA